ncbi:hypothetical protein NDI52_27545 [Leptolyngbya sp. PL-A3]|uniref:hypothetical protein n=1 Tax=Leptolyngbya sp. PL-A3 TaxID=2933911 RepID=UPI0032973CF4
MPQTYCHDCTHCNADGPTCKHPRGGEFLAYIVRCAGAGVRMDASDCPGFQSVEGQR